MSLLHDLPIADLFAQYGTLAVVVMVALKSVHHYVPVDFVRTVEGGKVHLDRPAEAVSREWWTS